jgi:hypothetical protein
MQQKRIKVPGTTFNAFDFIFVFNEYFEFVYGALVALLVRS